MASNKDRVARRYDRWGRWYDLFDLGGQGKQKRYSVAELDLKPGDSVLDVGCGTGAILGLVAQNVAPGGRVVAVDISKGMVSIVNRRFYEEWAGVINAEVGDVESLVYGDGEFDGVLATFAITSFPGPGKSLAEMARVLKSGGKLVILDTGKPRRGLKMMQYCILKPVMRLAGHTRIETDAIGLARTAGLKLLRVKRFWGSLAYCAVFTK